LGALHYVGRLILLVDLAAVLASVDLHDGLLELALELHQHLLGHLSRIFVLKEVIKLLLRLAIVPALFLHLVQPFFKLIVLL